MKISYTSLGLAAIAYVSAQASDPLAAPSYNQVNFAWTPEGNQDDLSERVDMLTSAMSELQIRSQLLTNLEINTVSSQSIETVNCEGAKTLIKNTFPAADNIVADASKIPGVGPLLSGVKDIFALANLISQGGPSVSNYDTYLTIQMVLTSVKAVLTATAFGQSAPVLNPVLDILNGGQGAINDLATCAVGSSNIMIDESHCGKLADIYRQVIAEAVKTCPALDLPTDASEDLKRLAAGSLSVLDLMDKSSIATTNDALLATRPIFAAEILEQYRSELIRVATTDDIQKYSQTTLGAAVGISNALEACLRIAADPAGALDDLNEELEDEDDEDDEDEDTVVAAEAIAPKAEDADAKIGGADAEVEGAGVKVEGTDTEANAPKVEDADPKAEGADAEANAPKVEDVDAKVEDIDAKVEDADAEVNAPKVGDADVRVEGTEAEANGPKIEDADPKAEGADAEANVPKVEDADPKAEGADAEANAPKTEGADPKAEGADAEVNVPKVEDADPKAEGADAEANVPKVEGADSKAEGADAEANAPKVEDADVKVEDAGVKVEGADAEVNAPKVEDTNPKAETEAPKTEQPVAEQKVAA